MQSLGVRSIGGAPAVITSVLRAERAAARDLFFFVGALLFFSFSLSFSFTGFTYSHIPSRPPSRPNPLSRYPPNPAAASNRFVEFTHTTPALIFGAMSSARLMFSVQTLAASPYGVLFASATDSSGVRKVIVTSTGPKISTCAIVDDGCTFVNSVGG